MASAPIAAPPPPPPPAGPPDRAEFSFDPPEHVAQWRPLVNWLLAIPHLAILYAFNALSEVLSVISWFFIVFTGRMPAGIANAQAMIMRYSLRTLTYTAFMREEYPPLGFVTSTDDPGEDQRVRVVLRPQLEGRNRLTTAFRIILVIPHVIVLALFAIAAFAVCIGAFFVVIFTGRWPERWRRFVLDVAAYWLRVQAYMTLLHDEYPTFSLRRDDVRAG
jgi:hypothetical protein